MKSELLGNFQEEYEKNPENYHKEFWKKFFNLESSVGEDDKLIETASKYLDKCKKYVETNNVGIEDEICLYPIVIKVIRADKKWPRDDFSPRKIINRFREQKIKINKRHNSKIDIEAQACLETANHFSKKDLMK